MLVRAGLRPNQVSVISLVFSVIGGGCFLLAPATGRMIRIWLLVAAAACVQLRLLCNMLDGLMAVEGGLRSKTGEIYNEFPDRVADVIFLVCAGYSTPAQGWPMVLGWPAAILALITAYVRALGGSLGVAQDFSGPMAKPHRMFVLTVASLLSAGEVWLGLQPRAMVLGLGIIIVGAGVTVLRRLRHLSRALGSP